MEGKGKEEGKEERSEEGREEMSMEIQVLGLHKSFCVQFDFKENKTRMCG